MPQIGSLDRQSTSSSTAPSGRAAWIVLVLAVWGLLGPPTVVLAGAAFTVGGRGVAPQDSNFAGIRHASPAYRIMVQINHDTQGSARLELSVIDEVYRSLLAQHRREPYLPTESVPVVFIADLKMRRFLEGPQRLLFGTLETEVKKQDAVYPSPTAIFVTDATLADRDKLRAALRLGLGYLFNAEFYRAVVGLDHAVPRPAD